MCINEKVTSVSKQTDASIIFFSVSDYEYRTAYPLFEYKYIIFLAIFTTLLYTDLPKNSERLTFEHHYQFKANRTLEF